MRIEIFIFISLIYFTSCIDLEVQVYYNGVPQPSSMYLRGDGLGLNWDSGVLLNPSNSTEYMWTGTFSYTSISVGSIVEMKPLKGDVSWSIGANFQVRLQSESSSVSIYPWFYSKHGEYKVIGSLFSPQLNNTRDIIVYTPPSYYENSLKQMNNVLIMHDGQNLFNASTSFGGIAWGCDETIDELVVEGSMEEVLIIGVYNTPDRIDEYTYIYDPCYTTNLRGECQGGGGKGDLYLDFLIENVVPFVKQQDYRILTDRENLGILGSSLGGLISCYGAWTRGSVYSKGGCMSSSFWWDERNFNLDILTNYPPPPVETFYLDSGDCCPKPFSDDRYQTEAVRNHMEDLGFRLNDNLFYYLDEGGQHNEYYWGRRFNIPMEDLYPIVNTPTTP